MPRIIGGVARGRRLTAPSGTGTRPTSDRMREGLFSTLMSAYGSLGGVRFLDLYAGSGSVGLEALSRGAAQVLLVENDRRAAATIAANVASVGLPGATIRTVSVDRLLAYPPDEPYDLVFVDPPYDLPDPHLDGILRLLRGNGWLADDGLAVVERASRDSALTWPGAYVSGRSRAYGEGTLWYAQPTLGDAAHAVPGGAETPCRSDLTTRE